MTPEQIAALRSLLALLVESVAHSPLTDDEDKRELMRRWFSFNQSMIKVEDHS